MQNRKKLVVIKKRKQPKISNTVDVVENYYINGKILVILDGNSVSDEDWILDAAYTFHICPNWDMFSTYEIVPKYHCNG